MVRTCASDILDALLAHGVEYLFCNLGTDHAPLIEELARRRSVGAPSLRTVLCPHENTAVHMAAGYAWATGRAQAVLVHVDVGTANAAMGLHNASRMHLPVMLFAGRAPYSTHADLIGGRNSYINFVQDIFDQASLVRPYAKWEYHLSSGAVAGEAIARALERAQAEPCGPVYLTAARETLAEPVSESVPQARPRSFPQPTCASAAAVDEVARRLLEAERPLLLTAYAGRDPEALALLDQVARFAAIRVVEFTPHTVNLDPDSVSHGGYSPQPHVGTCDVGVLLDIDVPWVPSLVKAGADSWWCQIDSDVDKAAFPLWPFPSDLRMQGRSSSILRALLASLLEQASAGDLQRIRVRLEGLRREHQERLQICKAAAFDPGIRDALNPAHVCSVLRGQMREEDILLNEGIRNAGVVFDQIGRSRFGTRVGPAGGGLGWSAGMALGIRLARPDSMVVNVVGDGSAYFGNPQSALAVAMRYQLPTLTVVLDNGGWSAVKEATQKVYPRGHAKELDAWEADLGRQTDFAMVARAAGAAGFTLRDPGKVQSTFEEAVASARAGIPTVVHVAIAQF